MNTFLYNVGNATRTQIYFKGFPLNAKTNFKKHEEGTDKDGFVQVPSKRELGKKHPTHATNNIPKVANSF